MQWIRIGSSLLCFSLLTACSGQSSTDKLTKELDSVKSWTATAHMVGDAWIKGTVPEAYAKETLSKTQEELQKETETLKLADSAPAHSQILEQLKQLKDTVAQMSKAVEQKDQQAMNQQIQQLSSQEQTISTLFKQQAGGHE